MLIKHVLLIPIFAVLVSTIIYAETFSARIGDTTYHGNYDRENEILVMTKNRGFTLGPLVKTTTRTVIKVEQTDSSKPTGTSGTSGSSNTGTENTSSGNTLFDLLRANQK